MLCHFQKPRIRLTLKVKCLVDRGVSSSSRFMGFFFLETKCISRFMFSHVTYWYLCKVLFLPIFFGPMELTNSRYGLEDATFHQYSWRAASCQLALYCHLDLKKSCLKSILRIIYLNEVIETSNFLSSQVVRLNPSRHLMMILAYFDVQKHIYLGIFTCNYTYNYFSSASLPES